MNQNQRTAFPHSLPPHMKSTHIVSLSSLKVDGLRNGVTWMIKNCFMSFFFYSSSIHGILWVGGCILWLLVRSHSSYSNMFLVWREEMSTLCFDMWGKTELKSRSSWRYEWAFIQNPVSVFRMFQKHFLIGSAEIFGPVNLFPWTGPHWSWSI